MIAHLATHAVAPVDDVIGDATVRFEIVSIANLVSDRNPIPSMHGAAQRVAVLRQYPAGEERACVADRVSFHTTLGSLTIIAKVCSKGLDFYRKRQPLAINSKTYINI